MTVAPQGEQNPAYSPGSSLYEVPLPSGTSLFFIGHVKKMCTFAAVLVKGMLCESATVPAAVSPRKACQAKPLSGSSRWEGDRLGRVRRPAKQGNSLQAFGNKGDA